MFHPKAVLDILAVEEAIKRAFLLVVLFVCAGSPEWYLRLRWIYYWWRIFVTSEELVKLLRPIVGLVVDVKVLHGVCMLAVAQASAIVHQLDGVGRRSSEVIDWYIPVVDDLVQSVPIGYDPIAVDVAAEFFHGRGQNVAHRIYLVYEIPGVRVGGPVGMARAGDGRWG